LTSDKPKENKKRNKSNGEMPKVDEPSRENEAVIKDQSTQVLSTIDPDFETIEISPEVVWTLQQVYQKWEDQEKVNHVLNQIARNNAIKQEEGQGCLKRLTFLLEQKEAGQKRDFQAGHVRILNVDFRYSRLSENYNNYWSIDTINRLKVFGAKIQVIFDKIFFAAR
jgi:hypothetical protein